MIRSSTLMAVIFAGTINFFADVQAATDSGDNKILPQPKGAVYLGINLPNINHLHFLPTSQSRRSNVGFLGIGINADYYHRDNQFINIMWTAVMDHQVPAPMAIDWVAGEWENMSAIYIGLTNNHRFNRLAFGNHLTLGYGVSYGRHGWLYRNLGSYDENMVYVPPDKDNVNESHLAAGLPFNLTFVPFHAIRFLNFGFNYRPTFMKFDSGNTWQYEHHIGLFVGCKFKLW